MDPRQSTVPCATCGTPISVDSRLGCPRCLLGAGLDVLSTAPQVGERAGFEGGLDAPAGFTIEERIGSGGTGVVYRARDQRRGRTVALKVLRADPLLADRLQCEIEALRRLNHPGIVRVLDAGSTPDGQPYLVLEYVDGVDLRKLLRTGPLAPERAVAIVRDVALALDEAHQNGIVHRDVKPENILVDRAGRARIADFGLARLLDPEGASTQHARGISGTPVYMAPEQIESPGFVDGRADVYGLGVVLYELLSDELPIGRFEAPSQLAPVGREFDEIVMRALHKRADRRFATAAEMAGALDAALGMRAVRPRDASRRLRRMRARRGGSGTVALAAALGAAVAGVMLWRGSDVQLPAAVWIAELGAAAVTGAIGERWRTHWFPRPGMLAIFLFATVLALWVVHAAFSEDVASRFGLAQNDAPLGLLGALGTGYLALVGFASLSRRLEELGHRRL